MKKRNLEKGERGFVIALGFFALVCLAASAKMFLSAPALSGEGTVPLLCSLVMLLMVGTACLEMRGCGSAFEDKLPFVRRAKEVFRFLFPGKVGLIVVYCLVYTGLLAYAGFAVSTFAFLVISMLTLNRAKKIRILVISGVAMVCIVVVFQYIFQVQLP
ncbi:MAG: tripartite tricarboxylate transporter TctB family protein [Oscillibacter sp.]|nr:tripartite tricarboxylate transporter TctB family protein [Oscillibacter sp.]